MILFAITVQFQRAHAGLAKRCPLDHKQLQSQGQTPLLEQLDREIPTVQRILITYSPRPCYKLPREKLTISPLHHKQENIGVSRILLLLSILV